MNPTHNLTDALKSLNFGDHLCLIYRSHQEQFAAVIPFIKQGLEKGEKCLYIVDERTAQEVEDALQQEGVDVQGRLDAGQLSILTKEDAYLKEGYFDPDKMIALLAESTEAALQEGYPGLRVTGEMTWIFARLPGWERLIEYEARLNHFFPGSKALAICQYSEARFSPELLLDVLTTHPLVIVGGLVCRNFYYVPPDKFLREKRDPKLEYARYLRHIQEREQLELAMRQYSQELERKVEEKVAEVRRRSRELAALFAIDRATAQSLDLEEIFNDALEETLAVLEIEAGGILLIEPDGETMALRVHRGLSEEFVAAVRRIRLGEGISGQAVAEGKPVVLDVPDGSTEPFVPGHRTGPYGTVPFVLGPKDQGPKDQGLAEVYPTERLVPFIVKEGFQTLASTPLISKGQVLGALILGTWRPRAFPPQELELLASIGRQLGIAFANAQLHEETQRRAAYLAALNQASTRVSRWGLDLEGVLQAIVTSLVEEIGIAFARIWLADETGEELILRASAGLYTRLDGSRARIRLADYPYKLAQIARERQPLLTNRVQEDDRFDCDWAREHGLVAFAGYPLLKNDRLLAVLTLFSQQLLDDAILDVLGSFANQAAVAIENARLYRELSRAKEELEEKVEKLETFYRITMGREKRIMELKEEVRELKKRLGEEG